jgi:hypothetical protein
VNLIQGRLSDVVPFLDQLTYGDHLPEAVHQHRLAWRQEMQTTIWAGLVEDVEESNAETSQSAGAGPA